LTVKERMKNWTDSGGEGWIDERYLLEAEVTPAEGPPRVFSMP